MTTYDLAILALLEHVAAGQRQHPVIEGHSPNSVKDLVGYCWACDWIDAKDVTSHSTPSIRGKGKREYMIKRLTKDGKTKLEELRASQEARRLNGHTGGQPDNSSDL